MATEVFGNVNVGLLFGLAQFVTTFVITHLYVAHANRRTDPIADEMRERLEHHEFAGAADGTDGDARGPPVSELLAADGDHRDDRQPDDQHLDLRGVRR